MVKLICKNCHKEFESKSYKRKYCSDECRFLMRNVIKTCPVCGKEFSTRKSRPYTCCSRSCAGKYNWTKEEFAKKCLASLEKTRLNPELEEKRKANVKKAMQKEEYKNKLKWHHEHNPNMGMKGKHHTKETIAKVVKAHLGKKVFFSEEHRHNLSIASKGKKKSKTAIENMKKSMKKRTVEDWKRIQQKIYKTKKENGSFSGKSKLIFEGVEYKCSQDEKIIFDCLNKRFYTIPQYRSEEYPFDCDFYIKDLDLYIEYQGYWTHGRKPYNKNDLKHQKQLNLWKERKYFSAINTWTIHDPLKRQTAKDNNLNWMEFFSIKEFMNWFNTIGETNNG